jgi:hypothetical protein
MKERPILFSGAMVRAILSDSKTQTRRVVTKADHGSHVSAVTQRGQYWQHEFDGGSRNSGLLEVVNIKCPYGEPGDHLYVRETWIQTEDGSYAYKATDAQNSEVQRCFSELGLKWKPSIFMPRKVSRITLEVASIRVERLQAISEEDAIAEGLTALSKDGQTVKYGIPDRDGLPGNDDDGWQWSQWCADPRRAYADLWDSINGKTYPWDSNPWVWVVQFKRI